MTRRSRYAMTIAMIAFGAAGGALLWHVLGVRDPSGDHAASLAGSAPGELAADPSRAVLAGDSGGEGAWTVGARRTYAAEFHSALIGNAGAPDGALEIGGTASLAFAAEWADGERVLLRGTLSKLSVTAGPPNADGKHIEDSIRDGLARPFLVKMRRSGQIESIETDRDLRGLGRNILRTLVASLGFVGPGASQDWREWTTEESDQNGIFEARYRQIEPGLFEKTKLAYKYVETENRLHMGPGSPKVKIESKAAIRRDRDGVLLSVDADERLTVPIGNASFQSKSRVSLRFEGEDKVELAELDRSRLTATTLYADLPANRVSGVQGAKQNQQPPPGTTLAGLTDELARTPFTGNNHEARWEITRRLTALLDGEPANIAPLRDKLKGNVSPSDREMMLAALSDSHTPEAQAALADLANDPDADPQLRVTAATHLGLQERPTNDTLASLKKLASDAPDDQTRRAATLALGSAARQGRESGSAVDGSQKGVQGLLDSLQNAQDANQRRVDLEALGNAGDTASLPAVESALRDPDPSVRQDAVQALRRIPGAEVDGLISNALGDPSAQVRQGALSALSDRPLTPALVDTVANMLKTEQDGASRARIVDILGRNLRSYPSAAPALEWAKDNDPSESIRQEAASALASPLASADPHR